MTEAGDSNQVISIADGLTSYTEITTSML